MGIEIARFSEGVPARDQAEMRIKALDAIERGETVWEALPEGEHELNTCLPVDDVPHKLMLIVTPAGTGFIRMIPRGPYAGIHDTEFGPRKGGTIIDLNKPDKIAPISQPEIKLNGQPTGRSLVFALVRHVPGPPPPNH